MLIQLGIINYKLLLPFIYPIFLQIRRLIHKDDNTPFFEFFANYCGFLCHGIIYLIVLKRSKNKHNPLLNSDGEMSTAIFELMDNRENMNSFDQSSDQTNLRVISINQSSENLIQKEKEKREAKERKRKYLNLLLLALINLIPLFLDSYTTSNDEINFKTGSSISVLFCFVSYVVLSRIILGQQIHRHQIVSTIIIIICTILSIILILIKTKFSWSLLSDMGLMALIYSLFALYNVLEKRYFNKYMDSPYHLMFVIGVISLIIILFYETITVLAFSKDEQFNGIFLQLEINFKNSNYYILLLISDILSAAILMLGINLTVYFLTPCHFNISDSIAQILSTFIDNILKGYDTYIKIIIYILFAIILFSSFIYNEIIIINACSLNKYTQKYIEERANTEKDIMLFDRKETLYSDYSLEESIFID